MVRLIGHRAPTEHVQHTETDTSLNVDGSDVGNGDLYITESSVMWLNPREEGIELEYKKITLHAISRDLTSFPHEHLLLHYEGKLPGVNESQPAAQSEEEEDMDSGNDDVNEGTLIEIRFVPQNKDALNAMFEAMSNCQVLHPDPDDDCVSDDDFADAEEEEVGDGFFTGEEGLDQLNEEGRANLERFNNMLQMGQGDADISTRTSQITIAATNGHHNPEDEGVGEEQFQDADGMNE